MIQSFKIIKKLKRSFKTFLKQSFYIKTRIFLMLEIVMKLVLSDCNSIPLIVERKNRGNWLQSKRSDFLIRGNELTISGYELLIRENGVHNSM